MKLRILLLAAIAVAVHTAPLDTSADNCIANYLKAKELLSSDFGNDDEVTPSCELIVDNIKVHMHKQLEEALTADAEMRSQVNCMIENVQETAYSDEMLVLYMFERDNVTMSEEKITERKAEIMHNTHVVTVRALLKCKSTELFGEVFDSLFNETDTSEEDFTDEEDYCVRVHVNEHDIIDKSQYNLIENPKNIDTTAIDCDAIYKSVVAKIEEKMVELLYEISSSSDESESESKSESESESSESGDEEDDDGESECLLNVIRTGNYVDKLMAFEFLNEFHLTDDQKTSERQKFITILSELTENFAIECLV